MSRFAAPWKRREDVKLELQTAQRVSRLLSNTNRVMGAHDEASSGIKDITFGSVSQLCQIHSGSLTCMF